MITLNPSTLDSLRTARAQCNIRAVQLSSCRVCGLEVMRYTQAAQDIDDILRQLQQQGEEDANSPI